MTPPEKPATPLSRDMFPNDVAGSAMFNALLRGGYETVESVMAAEDSELLDIKGFGVRKLVQVRAMFCSPQDLEIAYFRVIKDLERISAEQLLKDKPNRRYLQKIEEARAMLLLVNYESQNMNLL